MDEADFKLAIRLLHVSREWLHIPGSAPTPARQDPLYPGQFEVGKQAPLASAISELLERYPYEPDMLAPSFHSEPGSAERSQPSEHPAG